MFGVSFTISILIIVLLIVVVIKAGPWLIKQVEEIKKKLKDTDHQKSLDQRLKNIPEINNQLTSLREQLGGNRAYIFEFHNGGKNFSDLCFQHMTATHERNEIYEPSFSLKMKDLSLSLFPDLLYDMSQTDILSISKDQAALKYPILYQVIGQKHIKQLIFISIHGSKRPLGFCAICRNHYKDLTDKDKNIIQKSIQSIAVLLEFNRK